LANFGTACSSFIVVIIWPVGGTVEGKGERKEEQLLVSLMPWRVLVLVIQVAVFFSLPGGLHEEKEN